MTARPRSPTRSSTIVLALVAAAIAAPAAAQSIPTPESFFGHVMGADHQLARWDRMVEYYELIGERSPRVQVWDMGPTTWGNPFLALFVSSPENLARLDEIQRLNALLADPRGATEAEIDDAVERGRAVIVQSFGLHSSEVAGAQAAVEFVYDLATRDDEEMRRILDETVSIVIPAFNPDGQIMITDWYREWVGTEYEAAGLPYLYHPYIGHDNNRDAFQQNTVESRYGARIMFREWVPQAYVDHHQMGAWGARLYVPPYADPVRPNADPLVWREIAWYGGHIALEEEAAGKTGVINDAVYSGWGHFGFHWITPFHNIAGMLTESASARLATPLYLHPDQLRGGTRNLPEYEEQTNFPSPWPGGWWRVRDIVEQQIVAAMATLDIAARNREQVLRNQALKALRQTERGMEGDTRAYVIPAEQHDPLTVGKMVNLLRGQGIEVQRAPEAFTHEGHAYGAGTFVVDMAQPKRGVIRWLLGRTFYPDNTYTRNRDGTPIRPYDMSADVMAEYMGAAVVPAASLPEDVRLTVMDADLDPQGRVARGSGGYSLDGRLNDSFRAVNLLMDRGVSVRRVDAARAGLRAGDFVVPASAPEAAVRDVANETGVDFRALEGNPSAVGRELRRQRVGMYHRYYGGNMDEGWTRLTLETFGFPYDTLKDARIREGDLRSDFDVIILPEDGLDAMTGEAFEGRAESTPPDWRSGFGEEGVDALEAFVRAGGTLVTFAEAGDLPLEHFGLPVRNVVEGLGSTEFWSPGSTLRIEVDAAHPFGYGMPEDALAMFTGGDQVYEIVPDDFGHRASRVASYIERDILQSGWLLGEEVIAEKTAAVDVRLGEGRVFMIGFRPQHRMQTHGTFKLVFNALMGLPESEGAVAAGTGSSPR